MDVPPKKVVGLQLYPNVAAPVTDNAIDELPVAQSVAGVAVIELIVTPGNGVISLVAVAVHELASVTVAV